MTTTTLFITTSHALSNFSYSFSATINADMRTATQQTSADDFREVGLVTSIGDGVAFALPLNLDYLSAPSWSFNLLTLFFIILVLLVVFNDILDGWGRRSTIASLSFASCVVLYMLFIVYTTSLHEFNFLEIPSQKMASFYILTLPVCIFCLFFDVASAPTCAVQPYSRGLPTCSAPKIILAAGVGGSAVQGSSQTPTTSTSQFDAYIDDFVDAAHTATRRAHPTEYDKIIRDLAIERSHNLLPPRISDVDRAHFVEILQAAATRYLWPYKHAALQYTQSHPDASNLYASSPSSAASSSPMLPTGTPPYTPSPTVSSPFSSPSPSTSPSPTPPSVPASGGSPVRAATNWVWDNLGQATLAAVVTVAVYTLGYYVGCRIYTWYKQPISPTPVPPSTAPDKPAGSEVPDPTISPVSEIPSAPSSDPSVDCSASLPSAAPIETDQVPTLWLPWLVTFIVFVFLLSVSVNKFITSSSITNSHLLHLRSRYADQLDTAGEALGMLAAILTLTLLFLFWK